MLAASVLTPQTSAHFDWKDSWFVGKCCCLSFQDNFVHSDSSCSALFGGPVDVMLSTQHTYHVRRAELSNTQPAADAVIARWTVNFVDARIANLECNTVPIVNVVVVHALFVKRAEQWVPM